MEKREFQVHLQRQSALLTEWDHCDGYKHTTDPQAVTQHHLTPTPSASSHLPVQLILLLSSTSLHISTLYTKTYCNTAVKAHSPKQESLWEFRVSKTQSL